MTAPRQVLAGSTYLVTRRCTQRQFLLRPSAKVDAIFKYLLAVAAHRYGIRLHALCVMSNHVHLVLTDPRGDLPAFAQYLASGVARATNSAHGRWESFWAPGSYSAVKLLTPTDVVAKMAYVLANPVAAGLVRHGRDWPGLWSSPESIGGPAVDVERPRFFFDPNGPMPRNAALRLTRPAGFESPEDFDTQLAHALAELEAQAEANLSSEGRIFLGAGRVLTQKPTDRPASGEPRRALSPRVASRDKWKRIEALGRLVEFVARYREALTAWKSGFREALFPEGTYLLRITHAVRCEGCG
jgi:REP element-mobilizing transposase RayT